MLASYIARIGPCLPTPISPTPVSPTLDQKVVFHLLINLKQNLREEDNLSIYKGQIACPHALSSEVLLYYYWMVWVIWVYKFNCMEEIKTSCTTSSSCVLQYYMTNFQLHAW